MNQPATTVISTLSLRDALPILVRRRGRARRAHRPHGPSGGAASPPRVTSGRPFAEVRGGAAVPCCDGQRQRCRRSEEHTSELQSQSNLVCRLLLGKKNEIHVLH